MYEPDCIVEIKKLTTFQKLIDTLVKEISYYDDLWAEIEAIEEALMDYLLVAGRQEHDRENYYDEPAGKDEAIRLLLEDTYISIPQNRGFIWISGLLPMSFIIQIDDKTRIRRATRFELRAMESGNRKSLWKQ